jgi:hypothetical protein
MNVETYLKFALRPILKDSIQMEDLFDPCVILKLKVTKPMPISIAKLFLFQDPTFIFDFIAAGNSMAEFNKIREDILSITDEIVLLNYKLTKPESDFVTKPTNVQEIQNVAPIENEQTTIGKGKRKIKKKIKTTKTKTKAHKLKNTLCRHSKPRLRKIKITLEDNIFLFILSIYNIIIIFHTNFYAINIFMKNNNINIYKHMDPLFKRTYGTLHEQNKNLNLKELNNPNDQQVAMLTEQKILQDNLNKIKDQYTDYLTKSYKSICWKCGQLTHNDPKLCTKRCKYCSGNHSAKECLIKLRCNWCGQIAGEHKCLPDLSSSLLQIKCPLCKFRGHSANNCSALFQCLRFMYTGIKRTLIKNRTNFTGVRRRRFISRRRFGRNKKRRLRS